MDKLQKNFEDLLNEKVTEDIPPPVLTKKIARKLRERIDGIKLYVQAYTFTLHFRYGAFDVKDLFNFAHQHELQGVDIGVNYGKKWGNSLGNMTRAELEDIKKLAKKLDVKIVLEISSTEKDEVDRVLKIADILDVKIIRVYNRYSGYVKDCIKNCITDLRYVCELAEKHGLYFAIESHEAMKSFELAHIVKEVGSSRLSILFDFGNMINAYEKPLAAFVGMSPYVQWAHIKDVKIIPDRNGYRQLGVKDGTGDLPQLRMIYELLMLGGTEAQVKIFALQQVNGYRSPAYRFKDEGENPLIPERGVSITNEDPNLSRDENLHIEKDNVIHQIRYTRKLINTLREMSKKKIIVNVLL